MSPDMLFSAANAMAAICWLLLAILPRRRVVDLVARGVVPTVFAALYVVLIVANIAGTSGGFSSLAGVATLFANPWLLLAGWVHYLAFDLLIGTWEVRDASERNIPHWLVVPCLFVTFMFGPAGWLLYIAVRSALTRGLIPVRLRYAPRRRTP
jgi:hypothetical protein